MQAILTRYLPVTDSRGSRIKALCTRGSVTIPYPYELSGDEVHREAVRALLAKFNKETPQAPWPVDFVTGCLPSGDYAHVFTL